MSNPKTIIFRIGEETKPVISNSDNYGESILSEQISQALTCIQNLEDECKNDKNIELENSPFSDVYHNNIVSYIGERGSGKTSCMYSVANILRKKEESIFYCLDVIDPSFFDDHHNVIQIVIGKLYGNFISLLKGPYEEQKREHEIMELRNRFHDTKKHLRYLDKEPEFSDDNEMEGLYQLASGVDLKDSLEKLVKEFLKFAKKEVLLITIDDIDQNFTRAYEMAEQLRKYLIIPGVIIQIAAKLEQMSEVIQNRMAIQYKNLPDKNVDINYADMADRYLTKLLPLESRIYMPSMEVLFENPLRVIVGGDAKDIEIGDVKTTVTQLIFQKCRYLFYNTRGTTSYIVPRNLRELRMLLSLLVKMSDYRTFDENMKVTIAENNKDVFKNYLFSDWLNKLSEDSKKVARELVAEKEPVRLNKKVIQLLTDQYPYGYKYEGDAVPDYIAQIENMHNAVYNVSLGDTFTFMDYIAKQESQKDIHLLLFFIKTLYSIRLYEYYDMLTDTILNPKSISDSKPYRKDEILEDVSYLQKLVGGSYYYISGDTLMPTIAKASVDKQREIRLIDGDALNILIRDIVARYDHIEKASNADKVRFTEDLRIAEFFMLTTSRFIYSKGGGKESGNYRTSMDAYYDRDLSKVSNMEFNVTAPFFTLLDIQHTYSRFHPSIYSIAVSWEKEKGVHRDSLYNSLLSECHTREDRKPEHDMLSRSVIRNAEIAEDLFEYMQKNGSRIRPDGGEMGALADFYRIVFNYQIATYDREKDAEGESAPHIIRFTPFKVLFDFLVTCKDQAKFYSIYNKSLVAKVTPYRYLDKSMSREEIWSLLTENYPSVNNIERKDDFLYHFRSAKRYNRSTAIQKLDALSKSWGMKLDGTSSTNE